MMARAAIIRTDRYNRVAVVLHWLIAALVLFNLFVGLFHESLLDGVPVMGTHKAFGMLILLLTLVRIGWRFGHPVPPMPADTAAWERMTAKATHIAFYLLLLILPLSGWVMSSGARTPRPISMFGLFDVPLLPVSKAAGGAAHEAHEVLGYVFVVLVILHIAAALRHQFLLKDGMMDRMRL